jgi:predicted RNase H-like HicB family nuclease
VILAIFPLFGYNSSMKKQLPASSGKSKKELLLPLVIEQDEDGIFVVECPTLPGCYSQGSTLDNAIANIEEVIDLLLEEEACREILRNYTPKTVNFQTISVKLP